MCPGRRCTREEGRVAYDIVLDDAAVLRGPLHRLVESRLASWST